MEPEQITQIEEMQRRADQLRKEGRRIALVPTMGYLHEGHLSLMRIAREKADVLVVSIFVNPTQFGPNEDFERYPRDMQRDLNLIRKESVDLVFAPEPGSVYPKGFQTFVTLEALSSRLCGISRPVFFRGVATVVCKLFNIVRPHVAVFGRKDFQQLTIIRRMVRELNFDIEVIGGPIVREPDGLAMSSRNVYLNEPQRISALCLSRSLEAAQKMVQEGTRDASRILERTREFILSHSETSIDYVAICDPDTFEDLPIVDRPVLMALAVKVGKTRLIDNGILNG